MQATNLGGVQTASLGFGVQAVLPKNFVRHPVADSRKTVLPEEKCFEGCFCPTAAYGLQVGKMKRRG